MTDRPLSKFEDGRIAARLMSRVEPDLNGGCWLWSGHLNANGYGIIGVGSRSDRSRASSLTHRVSYEVFNGPIRDGLCVCHKCDVRACINPAHLWLGTRSENAKDCEAKGRVRTGPQHGSHNPNAKINDGIVRLILKALRAGEKQAGIAARMGVAEMTVSNIKRGKSWKHVEREF